jgi:flagellar hook-associated protein 2
LAALDTPPLENPMATISSTGIGSGLDVKLDRHAARGARTPADQQLQTESSKLDTRLSSFGKIQSSLDALRSAARTLTDTTTWKAAAGQSGDASAVGVTVSSGTSPGSYSVNVTDLAAAQMNASASPCPWPAACSDRAR